MAHMPPSTVSSWDLTLRRPCYYLSPASPVAVPRCRECLVLWTCSVMTRSPFLGCISRPPGVLLIVLQTTPLQAVRMTFPFCVFQPILLWFRLMVTTRSLFQTFLCFHRFLPLCVLSTCPLSSAHLIMVNIDLVLPLHHLFLLLLLLLPWDSFSSLSNCKMRTDRIASNVHCRLSEYPTEG
jgi:hypothetical protein